MGNCKDCKRQGDIVCFHFEDACFFEPINPPPGCPHEHLKRRMTDRGWEYTCADCGVLIEHEALKESGGHDGTRRY